ncbi:MAG: peptidase U32 family protein, partial [Clostridia bacterium]
MIKPEILSPAGDFLKLRMAIQYGADAVYLAGDVFGMRTASKNFDEKELRDAVLYAHARSVRVYVTLNTMPRDDEITALPAFLKALSDIGVDAVIVADIGVFRMVQRFAPKLHIHISTQASVVNSESARAWYELGAARIVLARELSLSDIARIRENTPRELELEAFVHGAMCMSYSGRCLLSSFMTGRDANRGNCAQPCRWKYSLREETRPHEFFD